MTKKVSEAPAAAEQPKTVEVIEISLELLEASAKNPRRTMNEADLQELAASIREHGIQVPLIVRHSWRSVFVEFEDGSSEQVQFGTKEECSGLLLRPGAARTEVEDRYEIVCGHRRSEAATIAGLEYVPCIVRELTDEQAAEIALVDNLQRVDVPAIEEAEAFGELLDRLHSIAAVAAKVGKEQSYVAKRLKLRTLTEHARRALAEQLITVDHALLLARLGDDEQNQALKWTLDHAAGVKKPVEKVIDEIVARRDERAKKLAEDPEEYSYYRHHSFEPQSIVRLKGHIAESSGTPLDRAPWPLDLDLGVDAPKCDECPQNTKANAPLFGDLDIGEPTCTDGGCFREKTQAFVRIQSRMSEGVAATLRVSWKATSTAPRLDKETGAPIESQTFKAGQWLEAKKRCEYSRAGVTVDWSDANDRGRMGREDKLRKPGEILQICIEPKCKAHPKAYGKPAKSNGHDGPRETEEQRQERERRKAEAAREETKVRVGLLAQALGAIKKFPDNVLRSILIGGLPRGNERKALEAACPDVERSLRAAKLDSLEFGRAVAAASITGRYLEVWEHWEPKQFRREFVAELSALGFDASKAWDKPKKPQAEKPAVKPSARKPAKKAPAKKAAAKKAPKPQSSSKKGGKR